MAKKRSYIFYTVCQVSRYQVNVPSFQCLYLHRCACVFALYWITYFCFTNLEYIWTLNDQTYNSFPSNINVFYENEKLSFSLNDVINVYSILLRIFLIIMNEQLYNSVWSVR